MNAARFISFAVLLTISTSLSAQTPLGTGITYQGQLKQNGAPMNGAVNLRFSLWDAAGSGSPPAGGNQIGTTQQITNVPIASGLFTVVLNDTGQFGVAALNGQARWLQVEVCADQSCTTRSILAPRQAVTPAPYATFSARPWTQSVAGGGDIAFSGGNVSIGTSSTTAGLHVSHEPTTSSGTLALEGMTHAYLSFYPDGFAAGRKGFFGFPCSTCNDLSLTNQISGGGIVLQAGSGGNVNIGATSALVVTGSGRVGIGTSVPSGSLQIVSTSTPAMEVDVPTSNELGTALKLNSSVSNGGVGMRFTASSRARQGVIGWADNFVIWNDPSLGHALLNDDGSWSNFSDRRMKTDITSAEGLLAKALSLRPAEFYMKGQDCTRDPYKYLGLIAQEVQPILPSLVHGSDTLTLNYDRIGVVAIGAIQEQQRMILNQKRILADQQKRIKELEATCAELHDADERNASRISRLAARMEQMEANATFARRIP